jgi:hypothetical protein
VLFVTHSLQQIYDLCDHALLLEAGKLIAQGNPREVGYLYEQKVHEEMAAANKATTPVLQINEDPDGENDTSGNRVDVTILTPDGSPAHKVYDGKDYLIRLTVCVTEDVPSAAVGFDIRTQTGVQIFGASSALSEGARNVTLNAGQTYTFDFSINPRLNTGAYFVSGGVSRFISGFEGKDHYSVIHFNADAYIVYAEADVLFPGLVNLGAAFLGEAGER